MLVYISGGITIITHQTTSGGGAGQPLAMIFDLWMISGSQPEAASGGGVTSVSRGRSQTAPAPTAGPPSPVVSARDDPLI